MTAEAQTVTLRIDGLPAATTRVLLTQYRIDETHSNAYAVWRQMGSPQEPSPKQYVALAAAGQLGMLDSPRWITVSGGEVDLQLSLPSPSVSLVKLNW